MVQEFWVYLFVDDDYVKCAKLVVSEKSYQLTYLQEYLDLENGIAIDPHNLPLYSKKFESSELFGALRDSAPDYWGRELLKRKFQVSDLNDLEYVLANNLEHVGALAYSPIKNNVPMKLEKSGWVPHQLKHIKIEKIIEQTELMIKDIDGEKLKELFEYGPTLGGGKPKISLAMDGQIYLAKYGTSLDSIPEQKIEFATMRMAKELGLNVPEIKLSKHANRDVFFIKRFDREYQSGKLRRYHFVSSLSLCDWHEFGSSDWSYPIFCDFIQKTGSCDKTIKEDLRELFRRVAFNIAVNNNDDHPRNHGLLYKNKEWRLSPLYDVVPKAIKGEVFTMAMSLGLYDREASKRNLLSAANYFKISKQDGEELIDDINAFVQKKWKAYFSQAGINESVIIQFENAMKIK